jgi:hypothetical protein
MNPATQGMEGNVSAPVLYMALELSNTTWRRDERKALSLSLSLALKLVLEGPRRRRDHHESIQP